MIWASQITPGTKNALRLRIAGSKGGLAWEQENPDLLEFTPLDKATRLLRRGDGVTRTPTRIPAGHPEGYLEAFATLYSDAADLLEQRLAGGAEQDGDVLADAQDGLAGMRFIDACVRSSQAGGGWFSA
jgi:predicted dehydrogenase